MEETKYQQAVNFVHGRTKFKKILTLDRMRDFCQRLGHPERKLKVIHITGTNGKGSTTAFVRQILMEKGFKVGSFTSPFIIKFNDRFCINGKMISDDRLVEIVDKIKPIVAQMDQDWADKGGGPTEFEIDTAIMFKYFVEEKVDYAVLEVGLGGTYDSTNVVSPLVSVITNVANDHLKFLGPTLSDVARNKAGIIKENTPIIIGDIHGAPFEVIEKTALEKHAPMHILNKDINVSAKPFESWGEKFDFEFQDVKFKNLTTSLMGDYQIYNAALAVTAVSIVAQHEKWVLSREEVVQALKKTTWPGRFEKVNDEPLIILDGAHNLQAVQELTKLLKQKFSGQQIHIILAILKDKQAFEMIKELEKIPNVHITLTKFNSPRPIADYQEIVKDFPQIKIQEDWHKALVQQIQEMDASDLILFAGSLYFVSEVRSYFK